MDGMIQIPTSIVHIPIGLPHLTPSMPDPTDRTGPMSILLPLIHFDRTLKNSVEVVQSNSTDNNFPKAAPTIHRLFPAAALSQGICPSCFLAVDDCRA